MNRIKIAVETSTSCVGKCVGCALTPLERSSLIAPVSSQDIPSFIHHISKFYNQLAQLEGNEHDMVVIELVIGEHFTFESEYLHSLCSEIKVFLMATQKKFILAISTSGLLLEEKMQSKVDIFREYFERESLEIHLVCNLNLFERFLPKYETAVSLFQSHFNHINILTNFDNNLSLNSCLLFSQFLEKYNITDVQLVYGLKSHNLDKTGGSKKLFFDLHNIILSSSVHTHRRLDISQDLQYIEDEDTSITSVIDSSIHGIVDKQVFISHTGDIYHIIPTMLGGIELDQRAGFKPISNIFSDNSFNEYLSSKGSLKKDLLKVYMKNKTCMDCAFHKECFSTGLPLLHNLFIDGDICHNPLIPFYERRLSLKLEIQGHDLHDWKIQ